MGTDYACCGTDDPIHAQVNTEIATRTADANIEQIQDELDNAKKTQEQINEKYKKLHEQYETEKEEKSKLMNQVEVETEQKYHQLTESQTLTNKEYDHKIRKSRSELADVQKRLDEMLATNSKYELVNDEIEQYKATNIALLEEVNVYKQNIDSLTQQNEEYLAMKTNLQSEIDELSQIIKSKQLENESNVELRESEMIKLQNQIKILQQQKDKMKELEAENAKQNEIINAINDQMNAQNDEKKTLEDELSRLQTKMNEYLLDNEADAKYAHLNEEYENSLRQKEKLMKEIEESNHRYNELNTEYEAKMEKYKIEIRELQQTLMNDQNNAMNEMEELKQENIKLDDVKNRLEEKINELTQIIDAKHSENIFNNQNDEMMSLQNEINELQQQKEKMLEFEVENERQRNMISQLTEKMNEEKSEKETLEQELVRLQLRLDEFEQARDEYLENNEADSKYMQLEIEYQRELQNKQELLQQIKESNEKYEELENAQNIFREKYEIKMEKYENEISKLQQTLDDTLGNDENTKNEMNEYKSSNTKLTEQLNEYKENIHSLIQQNEEYLTMKTNLQSEIDELSQIIKSKQLENESNVELQNQIKILQQQKDKMKELEAENTKQNEIINAINDQMNAQNDEKKTLEDELSRLQTKMSEYLLDNDESDSKYVHLSEEYEAAIKQKEKLMNDIEESSHRYNELNNEYEAKMEMISQNLNNLEQKTNEFDAIKQELESTINEKEKDANLMKEENEKLTALINEMNAKMEAKNNENLSLTKELDSMQFKLYKYEQKEDEEQQRLRQIEIDKIDLNYKQLHAIRSDETTLTPMRVQHVVDNSMATDFENIPGIVLNRYKTPTHDPESESMSELDADDEEIETSLSLASNDKLEIAKRKSIQKQQLFIQQEKNALHAQLKSLRDLDKWDMRKELNALKRINTAKKATMSTRSASLSLDNGTLLEYSKTDLTDHYSDLDVLTPVNGPMSHSGSISEQELPPISGHDSHHMFRFRSESRWDENEIKQQKKEMAEHMIHLVKTHVQKSVEYMDHESNVSVLGTESHAHIPALPPPSSQKQKQESNVETKATDADVVDSNVTVMAAESQIPPLPPQQQKSTVMQLRDSIKRWSKKATDVVSVNVTMESQLKAMSEALSLFLSSDLEIDKQIPLSLMASAKAIAWSDVVNASLGVGASMGTGIILAKLDDANGGHGWSGPCSLGQLGGQWGLNMGASQKDFLIIFRDESAVNMFIESGKINFGTSAEATIAIGPLGRNAQVEGCEAIVCYSMAKGMYVGSALLTGVSVIVREDANGTYYGKKMEIKNILNSRSSVENEHYDAICKMIDEYCSNYDASNVIMDAELLDNAKTTTHGNDDENEHKTKL